MTDHAQNPLFIQLPPDLEKFLNSLPKNPSQGYQDHVESDMEEISKHIHLAGVLIEDLAAYIAANRQALQDYHTFLDASTKGALDQLPALYGLPPQIPEEKEEFKKGQNEVLYLDSTTLYPLEMAQYLPRLINGLNAIHEELKTLKIKAGERQ